MNVSSGRLSDRLEAVLKLCPKCSCMADIGCDHGYISIASVNRHIADHAIACDINAGPLERAAGHIAAEDLSDRIETRLSDGLSAIAVGEADVIVIAGMGGRLIQRIIDDGIELAKASEALVLGAQSDVGELRRYLMDSSFVICDEDMVEEDGKYYPLMKIRYIKDGTVPQYSERELKYGPVLIQKKHPVLLKYLLNLKQVLQRNLGNIEKAQAAPERAADIRTQADIIERLVKEMS